MRAERTARLYETAYDDSYVVRKQYLWLSRAKRLRQ
jgi:hypothetical protein